MEKYPHTAWQFEKQFSTEAACWDYLGQLRWPEGYDCPWCGKSEVWSASRGRLICRRCRDQSSVTVGTIFQDTHKPLRMWFRAVWQITSRRHGVNAVNLQQVLGLGSYVTAWTWLHKLRRAMVRPGQDRLNGVVEVGKIDWGMLNTGAATRQIEPKALILVAAEEKGTGIRRIRLRQIPELSEASLHGFISDVIQPGSTVRIKGLRPYGEPPGYHQVQGVHYRMLGNEVLPPGVHRVVSSLKRWMVSSHLGAVHRAHLDYYLDEFTFRFNHRSSCSRGEMFYLLLQQAMHVDPVPYRQIVGGKAGPKTLEGAGSIG